MSLRIVRNFAVQKIAVRNFTVQLGACLVVATFVATLVAGAYAAQPTAAPAAAAESATKNETKRVLFLGDSITHSGQYVAMFETTMLLRSGRLGPDVFDLGLSSETVSGLSEEGHAGGKFPRPDLHERLERVLSAVKPGMVVACYGMNDGIYHPFGEERFAAYKRGMEKLRERAEAHGALVLHVTPPVFDPEPIRERTLPAGESAYPKPYAGYDEVLTKYAEWLVSQRSAGWIVLDVHTPMKTRLEAGRAADPKFTLAPDGVHPNLDGHWVMAVAMLREDRVPEDVLKRVSTSLETWKPTEKGAAIYALVHKRQQLRHDAWLSKTGHKRPGVKEGLPVEEAEAKAKEINAEIVKLLAAE
jgi:lysophospholipase L1-like esterase